MHIIPLEEEIDNNSTLLDDPDPDIRELAKEEMESLNAGLSDLEQELKLLLLPKDPNDEKNILL